MAGFDPELINDYLSRLTPQNVLMTIIRPEAATDRVEPWFKVPYALAREPVAVAATGGETSFEFHLPGRKSLHPRQSVGIA